MLGATTLVACLSLSSALPELELALLPAERERYELPDFYQQFLDAGGIGIAAPADVSPFALREAAYLMNQVLDELPQVRAKLVAHDFCFVIMGSHQMITELPQFADFTPKAKWDYRVRGVFSTAVGVVSTCGEENLLSYRGDPRPHESVFIHELGHAIHAVLPASYDRKVEEAYNAALAEGLWKGTYAETNSREYWAEGFQCWYDANAEHDNQHNHVNTREELARYDVRLAALIEREIGEPAYRFVPPFERSHRNHLLGFDRRSAPAFQWPREIVAAYEDFERRELEFKQALIQAQRGAVDKQVEVGRHYRDGVGVERDDKLALKWFKRAAAKNDPGGQVGLGTLYAAGRGVKRNETKAKRYFHLAARKDDPEGQFRLGLLLRDTPGPDADPVQALVWLGLAADAGHGAAGVEFARLAMSAEREDVKRAQSLVNKRRGE